MKYSARASRSVDAGVQEECRDTRLVLNLISRHTQRHLGVSTVEQYVQDDTDTRKMLVGTVCYERVPRAGRMRRSGATFGERWSRGGRVLWLRKNDALTLTRLVIANPRLPAINASFPTHDTTFHQRHMLCQCYRHCILCTLWNPTGMLQVAALSTSANQYQ